MRQNEQIVIVEELRKRYGETEALVGLDFAVRSGTVFGLLGPNGAGKTTAVRILSTLVSADSGRAEVAGFDVAKYPQEVRRSIGLTGQFAAVDELLTGRQNLELFGRLSRLSAATASSRADVLLHHLDLADAADRVVKGYSGGMQRRLDLAASMIANPPVIFLDEPTTGLDPRSRQQMWELIGSLVREGTSILLTTHYLEEADRLADDIVIIDHGRAIARGTPESLKADAGGALLEVTLQSGADLDGAVAVVRTFGSEEPHIDRGRYLISVPVSASDGVIPKAVLALDAKSISVADIGVRNSTLDDVFLNLTGRSLEEVETDSDSEVITTEERR